METDFAGRSVGAGYVEGLDAEFVARGYVSENSEGDGAWGSRAGDWCGSGVVVWVNGYKDGNALDFSFFVSFSFLLGREDCGDRGNGFPIKEVGSCIPSL